MVYQLGQKYIMNTVKSGHLVDIINTALTGKRAKINNKRNFLDEIFRMNNIFTALFRYLKINQADVAHINSSCGSLGIIRDYLIIKVIKRKNTNCSSFTL